MNKLTMKNVNRRNLTPQGRLTVLKTLLLPQLSHIFASFPSPSDSQLKNLDFFFTFVRGNNNFRVKKYVFTKIYNKGDFKMMNIKELIMSLNLMSLKKHGNSKLYFFFNEKLLYHLTLTMWESVYLGKNQKYQ